MRYIILTFLLSISSFSQNLAGFYNDQISVAPGEIIEIDLIISNEEEIAGFQFNISNPSAFQIQSIESNEIFSDFQIDFNNEAGLILMISFFGSTIPVGDQQHIFTISLMVSSDLNSGEYDLTFINPIFSSAMGTALAFETPPLSVTSNMISVQSATASLNDLTNTINIFPNPSSEYINVTIGTDLEAVVFDLLGKELIRKNITGRLDISSLEKGTYILNLTDGINTSTHKIIKE
tara:strand:+ start:253 stop:957 length:705 start_codon:yes stop_codon:yes gene_type:complete